jgi:hypothetical protein
MSYDEQTLPHRQRALFTPNRAVRDMLDSFNKAAGKAACALAQ